MTAAKRFFQYQPSKAHLLAGISSKTERWTTRNLPLVQPTRLSPDYDGYSSLSP
jgi:hypothetical protein